MSLSSVATTAVECRLCKRGNSCIGDTYLSTSGLKAFARGVSLLGYCLSASGTPGKETFGGLPALPC
jgi:hypothetical protein